jgi:hypothetical protein
MKFIDYFKMLLEFCVISIQLCMQNINPSF